MAEREPSQAVVSARSSKQEEDNETERSWGRRQSLRPWRLLLSVVFTGLSFVAAGIAAGTLQRPTGSDLDLAKASEARIVRPWAPSIAVQHSELALIDMERVHAELLPRWVISLQHGAYASGRWESEQALTALTSEAGKDPNLKALLEDLNDKITDSVTGYAPEIRELFRGWNGYMERNSLPWHVEHDIASTAHGGSLYIRSYKVVSDLRVEVGAGAERARILVRADKTNLGELFFGVTSRHGDGAMIMSDRIGDYAIDKLWPIIGESPSEELTPADQAIAPFLQREASEAIARQSIDSLKRGAKTHHELRQMLAEIDHRRGCGASIEVPNLPWNGLTVRSKQIISRAAEKNQKRHCPKLTRSDAERLFAVSDRLSSDAGFVGAMGELSAWLARAVTVHEARHAADESRASARESAPACLSCPSSMGATERSEASAYLAALSTPGYGYVSLMQACGVNQAQAHSNGAALSYVLGRVVPGGCDGALPTDLYVRARALEMELFGRSDEIVLPESFPRSLALGSDRLPVVDGEADRRKDGSRWLMLREPKALHRVTSGVQISSSDLYVRL